MKLKLIMLASVFALGFAFSANAGSVVDTDGDLVPDAYDNCLDAENGPSNTDPLNLDNQVDSNQDGYGNRCDPDYNNDGGTTTADFSNPADPLAITFLAAFTGANPSLDTDHNGDGATTTADFLVFLDFFQNGNAPAGPSGLACAGTIPCLP